MATICHHEKKNTARPGYRMDLYLTPQIHRNTEISRVHLWKGKHSLHPGSQHAKGPRLNNKNRVVQKKPIELYWTQIRKALCFETGSFSSLVLWVTICMPFLYYSQRLNIAIFCKSLEPQQTSTMRAGLAILDFQHMTNHEKLFGGLVFFVPLEILPMHPIFYYHMADFPWPTVQKGDDLAALLSHSSLWRPCDDNTPQQGSRHHQCGTNESFVKAIAMSK